MLPAGLLVAAFTEAALAQGGFRFVAAVIMALLLAGAVATSVVKPRWSAAELPGVLVVPAALLGAWAVVRGAISPDRGAGLGYAMLLLGVLVVIVLVRRMSVDEEDWFVTMLLLVGVLLATTGWVGVVFRVPDWGHHDGGVWRAATSITYENAAAAVLVPLALLALAMSVRPGDRGARQRSAVVAVLLLTGAGATQSRAGAVALVLGLAVLVAYLRRTAVGLIPPLVGAGVAFCSLLPSLPAERAAVPLVAFGGLAVGIALSVAPVRPVGVAGLVGGIGFGVLAAVTSRSWVPIAGTRLSSVSVDRAEEVRAALALWRQHVAFGTAPGQAGLYWERAEGLWVTAIYAHNEYVQVLVELGVVGLVLLTALVLGLGALIRRGAYDGGRRALHAGAVAGVAAFGLHSSQDFLWHVPVVPLVAAALIAVATRREDAG